MKECRTIVAEHREDAKLILTGLMDGRVEIEQALDLLGFGIPLRSTERAVLFNKTIENAMRYSIEEAIRRQCRSAGGGTSIGIAEDAVETFKRKMETHTSK